VPDELIEMVMVAVEEAGEMGITTHGIKRRCQGSREFGRLVEVAVARLVELGELRIEKRAPTGSGRGRPRHVVCKGGKHGQENQHGGEGAPVGA
jgi:hypothetical protein